MAASALSLFDSDMEQVEVTTVTDLNGGATEVQSVSNADLCESLSVSSTFTVTDWEFSEIYTKLMEMPFYTVNLHLLQYIYWSVEPLYFISANP